MLCAGLGVAMAARWPAMRPDGSILEADNPNRIVVTEEQHAAVRRSEALRKMLTSGRLERCIRHIDGSTDRAAALERARLNPEFAAFLDQLLVDIGMARRRPDGGVEFTG